MPKAQIANRLKPVPCWKCGGRTRCYSKPYTHDKFMVVCLTNDCNNYAERWYDTRDEAVIAWNNHETNDGHVEKEVAKHV